MFTRALHWSLSWATSIQSIPLHPISLRTILLLSSHLRLGLTSGLSPGFPTKILYAFLGAPCAIHALPVSSSLTLSFWLYLAKSTSYEAPHYAVSSDILLFHLSSVQNTLLSTLFLNTRSIFASHHVRDKVSHPYKTTRKIILSIF
jgi:hypothetical protein